MDDLQELEQQKTTITHTKLNMTSSNRRIAQPGDIFLLLVPSAQELHLLRQWQAELQDRYGGWIVDHVHVTSQRFTPRQDQHAEPCIDPLIEELQKLKTFPIFTDMLIQFYSPFGGTHVLRWRVKETDYYAEFRDKLDNILLKINCPSHFDRLRHATCTALNLEHKVELTAKTPGRIFPAHLFNAREILISQLTDKNNFNILETIILK